MTQAEADALPIGSLARCLGGWFSGDLFRKIAQDEAGCRLTFTDPQQDEDNPYSAFRFDSFSELKVRFALEALPDLCLPVNPGE